MASHSFTTVRKSTIFKKIVMSLSGLFLVIFVIIHMAGNLSFIFGGADAFNTYSHKLIALGPLLYLVEIVLLGAFIVHAWNAAAITIKNKQARPVSYRKVRSAGSPSKKNISSISMILTGILVLGFLIIHLKSFKYGPVYLTMVNKVEMRDLYRLVVEKFRHPGYAFGYVSVMILLGYHLRHGFWSAFQSLGANHPKYSGAIYLTGVFIAIAVTFGFLCVPLYVFFCVY